jgi:tetratricopeptide (TPR) repeat protein
MALVEFTSEYDRKDVVAALGLPDVAPPLKEHPETAVRILVDDLLALTAPVVSIGGLEAALPRGQAREEGVAVLNFMRETIAGYPGRQIWWVTPETAGILRRMAPDWVSWMFPRYELASVPRPSGAAPERFEPTISLDFARDRATDARERIPRAIAAGEPTAEVWSGLAYPAVKDLLRAGVVKEAEETRAEFLRQIYGLAEDRGRAKRVQADVLWLVERGQYPAAASLVADGEDVLIEGASPERQAEVWALAGLACLHAGRFGEAEPLLVRALETRERVLGTEHPETLTSVNNLASLYDKQGRFGEAEPLNLRALAGWERVLGADHPDTLVSVNNLAGLYRRQGRLGEAEPLYLRALAGRERTLGAEDQDTLTSVNNLAGLYASQGRLGEAEPLFLRALARNERALGAEHPSTLTSVNNLAFLYERQGRFVEAEPLLVRALEARERVLGAEHPLTLTSVNNLAGLYHSQERLVEAEPLYLRALAGKERVLGAEHPDTLTSVNNLGVLRCRQGRFAEAEGLLVRAVAGRRAVLGAEHPDTVTAEESLATLRREMGGGTGI